MLVLEERGKPEYPEKNLSEQSREPTNSAHLWLHATLVGGECSTTAPTQLPLRKNLYVSECLMLQQFI